MDSGMEWGSSSSSSEACGISRKGVVERAKEELEILEMQHPLNFHSLKLELRAFISHHSRSHNNAAATQESSSSRKLKRNEGDDGGGGGGGGRMKRRRCKTDVVLERAQQCLHKIQHLKTSLLC